MWKVNQITEATRFSRKVHSPGKIENEVLEFTGEHRLPAKAVFKLGIAVEFCLYKVNPLTLQWSRQADLNSIENFFKALDRVRKGSNLSCWGYFLSLQGMQQEKRVLGEGKSRIVDTLGKWPY